MKIVNLATRAAIIMALLFASACTPVDSGNIPDNGDINNENNGGTNNENGGTNNENGGTNNENGGTNNENGGTGGNDEFGESALTPGQHQQRLEDIAIEFIGYFNPEDVNDIYDSAERFDELLDYFEEPTAAYAAKLVPSAIKTAASLSPAKLADLVTRTISEDIIIDPNDGELNPYAGYCYTFNALTYKWDRTRIEANAIRFCWGNDTMNITWTNCKKWDWDNVDDGEHYIVYVPANIEFSLTIDGVEHANISITTNLTDNQTMAPTATMTINGGYEISVALDANPKGVSVTASISKNDKNLMNGAMVVAINDLTNPDNWIYSYWCDNCAENHTDIDPSEYFLEQVKTGEAQIQVLDFAILISGDFKGMYKTFDNIYENYDGEEESNKICEQLNEKVQAVAIYTDTKEKVADIKWQAYLADEWYDEWDGQWYRYYSEEPILVFPDDSKFAFDRFFTERAFSSLIDVAEEFAQTADDLFNFGG